MSVGELHFYVFPNNTAGSAAIPILATPTPLAFISPSVDTNTVVSLRANIGWLAVSAGVNVTNVIFKIWRGAPVTGTLVVSTRDSGESNFDNNKATTFTGIDFGFSGPQRVTYVLTAELPDPGTAATVIGGLTFTSAQYDLSNPNRPFFFVQLPNNTAGSVLFPVGNAPVPLAALLTRVTGTDTAFIRAMIGWTAQSRTTNILFKIWRGAPFTGKLVASALDSGESIADRSNVTSFSGVDTGLTPGQDVVYFLTAETTDPETLAQVVGPMSLTAFLDLPSPPSSFFALPDNTSGSVTIPITATPQSIASLNINVGPTSKVLLRGTVGWRDVGFATPRTAVAFKIWRGAPGTGTLIYSVIDSADVDRNKTTAFGHVDTGFTAPQNVTYTVTVELVDPTKTAEVIGPVTLTASDPVDEEEPRPGPEPTPEPSRTTARPQERHHQFRRQVGPDRRFNGREQRRGGAVPRQPLRSSAEGR